MSSVTASAPDLALAGSKPPLPQCILDNALDRIVIFYEQDYR
ncbi:hypothetical protein [Bradyrhizobium japonicum]